MTDELTDRSLDGRGDERGRCPATLFAQRDHARCSEDRGHDGRHHSIRLAAHWSRDEPMTATLTPAGPEWEEFKAWKADKERADMARKSANEVHALRNYALDGAPFEAFHERVRYIVKRHEAGEIDLSICDEGNSE